MLGDLEVAEDDTGESVEDVLAGLEPVEEAAAEEDDPDLGALLGDLEVAEDETGESVEDVLAGLEPVEEASAEEDDTDLGALLGDLEVAEDDTGESVEDVLAGLEPVEEPAAEEEGTDLEALLGELDATDDAEASEDDVDLADLLGETETTVTEEEDEDLDLEALLAADEEEPAVETSEEPTEDDIDLDALLAGDDEGAEGALGADDLDLDSLLAEDSAEPAAEDDFDLDALLAEDVETDTTVESADAESDDAESDDGESDDGDDDLDDLLAGLDLDDSTVADDGDDLDALLSGLDAEAASDDLEGLDDLDALLGDLGEDDGDSDDLDLDSLLGDLGDDEDDGDALGSDSPKMARAKEPELAYGTMSADRPEPQKLARKRFRLAVFGDFTGRASKGQIEIGEALAARKPMVLDPDTFEDVIESFATELVLPIGKDGAGIAVKLGEFDDLHPDELYDNVALFSELVSLRKQLQSGVTKDHAMKTLASWAEAHGTPARAPKSRSGGNAVPADKRLSDFQRLIGDTDNSLRQASPVEEMLARVVGPHIRALPDPNLAAMQDAVDQALSDAMRLVLHHPEFQSVEAQWRSLDLIQRSIEVDDTLDVMLYDVSAEELAADLAAHEDLSQSGFVRLLTEEPMDEENGRGAYSALIGLYTFEETPPHAELLGRFARVAAHVDAPFLAAITPGFWDHAKEDRPKIVADAWDTLTGMSEAGHLGLLTPRFLLRRPYGAKGEPIDPFDFEEFTQSEGLRGMLWGNPVVLAAILMAKSFKENGASLQLGSIMSLGDMPFHFVTDRFGDQVALPCTERNVDLDKIAAAKARGFMPIAGVRGRDEIRLTSFNSLRGEMLLGPWTGEPAPAPSPPDPRPAKAAPEPETDTSPDTTEDGDDLDLDFDLDFDSDGDGGDDDLDALLASFDDDDDSETDGDIDADLEALLNDL
ncbi:type VI secretion system contractile sheath large subunit [Phaeobacter sp. HF9A]|uniref:type VI secretion system contractile sheath domain-containing protein n=1 Tax=Phaeobacter sp. HF9A TaxID=2721561 RepID=UPI0034C62592